MAKLFLITGFLGVGKTTFLKNFIRLFREKKLHIIVNEYGKEGIDGTLLKEVGMAVDEISNGSIFCSCRLDKFEEVLKNALEKEPDVIVIEASGLSNPVNVRKIMAQQEKFPGLEYMGSICIVDARRFHKVFQTATVVKKQISISDIILINKKDVCSKEELETLRSFLQELKPDIPILETSYGRIEAEWLEQMKKPVLSTEKPEMQTKDITLRSYLMEISGEFTAYELEKFLEMFLEETYRVKGFVQLQGVTYLVDCAGSLFRMETYEGEPAGLNRLVILAGNGLHTVNRVKEAIKWYPQKVKTFGSGKS